MPDTTPDAGTGTSSSLPVVESLDVKCMARVKYRQADDLPVLERKGGSSTMSDPEPGIQRTLVTIKPEDMLLAPPGENYLALERDYGYRDIAVGGDQIMVTDADGPWWTADIGREPRARIDNRVRHG
jgi:hypothetical protein